MNTIYSLALASIYPKLRKKFIEAIGKENVEKVENIFRKFKESEIPDPSSTFYSAGVYLEPQKCGNEYKWFVTEFDEPLHADGEPVNLRVKVSADTYEELFEE